MRILGVWAACVVLAGCSGYSHYRDGSALLADERFEDAIVELREAVRSEPSNVEYRIALRRANERAAARIQRAGDQYLIKGELEAAAREYSRLQLLENGYSLAKPGLDAVAQARFTRATVAEAKGLVEKERQSEALALLESVAKDSPGWAQAQTLLREIKARGRDGRKAVESRLSEVLRRTVTVDFRDAPIRGVFDVLARASGVNFVFDRDVPNDLKTTLVLRETTIGDALNLALLTTQLDYRLIGHNLVMVFPNTKSKLAEYEPVSVRAFHLNNTDARTIAATLKTLLRTRDIVVDEKQNLILMRESPEMLRLAQQVIEVQDQPEGEVMLEVEILEVKRSKLTDLGVQYPDKITLSPISALSGAALTLADLKSITPATTAVTTPSVTVAANQNVSDINLLANPRIRTRSREKAKIQVGQRVPNITTTATSTGFVAESIQYVDVGLKLEVEPVVTSDGEVSMKLALEVSNIVSQVQTKTGTIAYEIGTRNATSALRMRDGENQVLGGLISDEDRSSSNRVPVLGAIPLLGRLFGLSHDDAQKTEIVLSITPHLVRPVGRAMESSANIESGTESNIRFSVTDSPIEMSESSLAGSIPSNSRNSGANDWRAPDECVVNQPCVLSYSNASVAEDLQHGEVRLSFDPAVLEFGRVEGVLEVRSERPGLPAGPSGTGIVSLQLKPGVSGAAAGSVTLLPRRAALSTSVVVMAGAPVLEIADMGADAAPMKALKIKVK